MKRSAYIEQAKLPANVKQRRSYRTLARWAERDAFSFDDIQLSDISTIAFDELKSNNDHTSSDSKCETHNYSSSTDDARYQTSTDCVEPSIVSTQIVRCESNNEEIMTLFAKRGGRNAYEITTNILSKAFTNKFACEFSYFGKQKKKALSKFKITKCIIETVMKCDRNIKEDELQRKIGNWLANAPQRVLRERIKKDEEKDNRKDDEQETDEGDDL